MSARYPIRTPQHASYKSHRRQMWAQIILPVILGAVLFMLAPTAFWLLQMQGTGDVGRWAAISSMWLLIPIIIGLIILLGALVVAIYLASRVAGWVPAYSLRAQRLAGQAALATLRGSEMVRKPVLALRAFGNAAKQQLRRLRERA